MIRSVKLENFRNYAKAEVGIDSDLVLVLGDNASGKTNFIESVYYISRLKSFRAPDNLLVQAEKDHFTVECKVEDRIMGVVVIVEPILKKGLKQDNIKVKKNDWQSFRTVLFVPNDLNLFTLGPVYRRKFLNETLSQIDKIYAADLVSLDHVLKQKAALLNKINNHQADEGEFVFWNEQLAILTVNILKKRLKFIEFLRERFALTYKKITGFENVFDLQYKQAVERASEDAVLAKLKKYRDAEVRSNQNLVGPQREDFTIHKDSQMNIYNSSRGELRSQILTLKLLQAEYLSSPHDKPVILLDDVFSELDEIRRAKLLENLSGHQIFITSTEEHHLPKLISSAQVLKVENGIIV